MSAAATETARAGKYLTFLLGREEFAVGVLQVREILPIQDITAVPHTPEHVKGVINLRGQVVPVVDLRRKLGLPPQDSTPRTCIVVVQTRRNDAPIQTGVLVDAVSEVLSLAEDAIVDAPDFAEGAAPAYLLGLAHVKGRVKILLDIERVLHEEL